MATRTCCSGIMEVGKKGVVPMIVVVTGIIEEYADAGRTIDALVVYLTLLVSNVAPQCLHLQFVIKALAADPDPKFLEVAKECILDDGKGMAAPMLRPTLPCFKAFALQEKAEEGKQFREEMEAKGFVVDKMDVIEVLKGTTGTVVKSIHNILFGKESLAPSIFSMLDYSRKLRS
ncbi:hypothetical protein M0R45_028696 [Rubus argutus]|uniref:Uncharacterized protein n=1 Tax=Rubus argutus TaxID=59490 RepID=A0AAW1W5F4_RUBAR